MMIEFPELARVLAEVNGCQQQQDQLSALRDRLSDDERRAAAEREAAAATHDDAQTNLLLSAPGPEVTRQAGVAHTALQDAETKHQRIKSALRALPLRQEALDQTVTALGAKLREAAAPVIVAVKQQHRAEMQAVVAALARVLRRGLARHDALSCLAWLADVAIREPAAGGMLIAGLRLGSGEDLGKSWRGDPEAAAVHASLLPLQRAQQFIKIGLARIDKDRQRALAEANRAAAGRRIPDPPRTTEEILAGWTPPPIGVGQRFIPVSWTESRTSPGNGPDPWGPPQY